MKKVFIIILIALVALVATTIVWELIYIKTISIKEVHILPKNFKGIVMIIYNQKQAHETIKENGSIVYKIPPSGILLTKESLKVGFKDINYYYEDKGQLQELIYCWDSDKFPDDKVMVYGGSSGTNGIGADAVDFTTYFVSMKAESDSLSKVAEKLHPLEILKQQPTATE